MMSDMMHNDTGKSITMHAYLPPSLIESKVRRELSKIALLLGPPFILLVFMVGMLFGIYLDRTF